MSKIEIKDLNEDVTLTEESVQHVRGGTPYIKLGDIVGESLTVNSFVHKGNTALQRMQQT